MLGLLILNKFRKIIGKKIKTYIIFILQFHTLNTSLNAERYLGMKIFGLKIHLINHPKYNVSKRLFIGACCFVKYDMAAPEQIIKGL